jgi:hypothetical protein
MFENLLKNKVNIKFFRETNCYAFEIENFLSQDQYESIYNNLPVIKISEFKEFNKDFDNKDSQHQFKAFIAEGFTDKYNKFIYENIILNEFVKTMKSPEMIKMLMKKFFWKILISRIFDPKNFLKLLLRKNRPVVKKSDKLYDKFLYNDILCNVSLTYSCKESQLFPHTDGMKKILSLMLYFPDKNMSDSIKKNLGTTFWDSAEFALTQDDLKNKIANLEDAEKFKKKNKISITLPFKEGSLFGFIKSHKSWHSVEPSKLDNDYIRKNLIINLLLV